MLLSEWREFPTAPCFAGKKNLITARVSMLLKSRASLTWFRARFPPGKDRDLSAPLYSRDSDKAESLTSGEEIVLLLASCNKIPIRFF